MKRILTVLGMSTMLIAGFNTTAFATTRAIPVHFVNVLNLPETINVGVGEMLCVVAGTEVSQDVTVNLVSPENGPVEPARSGLDQRPGARTVACFDTVAPGDAVIEVSATVLLSFSRIESKVHVKVE